jgi:hypothetical protein
MAQHAGLLGRHKPFYPEHDVKLLTLKMSDPPPIIENTPKKRKIKHGKRKSNLSKNRNTKDNQGT